MSAEVRRVVKTRVFRYPRARVWRALTEAHLIAEWLMPNDFRAEVGHRFQLQAPIGPVACEVLAVEPPMSLSFSWRAMGLDSVVTYALAEVAGGTELRVEHAGFRPDQGQAERGATAAWARFLERLEGVLDGNPGHQAEGRVR